MNSTITLRLVQTSHYWNFSLVEFVLSKGWLYNAKYVSQELSQFSHGVVYRYGVGEGLSSALCQADFSSFNMVGFWESCPEIIDKVYIFSEGNNNLKKSSNFL